MISNQHWLYKPANIKLLWRIFLALLALTVVAEFFVPLKPHFAVEALPAFYAAYGFFTCVAMILAAKAIGLLLKRPETYYKADNE